MTMFSKDELIKNLRVQNKKLEDKYETIKTALKTARSKLYNALPSGDIDPFDLIKIIKTLIEDLDKILEVEV